jgi:hypothetical protein
LELTIPDKLQSSKLATRLFMILQDYLLAIELPNSDIPAVGEISNRFRELGIKKFWDAMNYVQRLPYGRTHDRTNYRLVLSEQRGACSVKHALIAALAKELKIELKLMLGIFLQTAETTPQIIPILTQYKIDSIPEAHTYLKYQKNRLDITFPKANDFTFNMRVEREISITPEQIGEFKIEQHQAFIRQWLKHRPELNFEYVWHAREAWIKHLSQSL